MRHITPRTAGLLAALLVGAFFAIQVGSPNGILRSPASEYTDLLLTHWPNAYFFQQSVRGDHCWPLWDPLIFSGTPFAANPLSGIWYPPNWVLLVLPITPGLNLLLVVHLMLGAAGAARLVDRLRTSSAAGWVGPLVGGLAWGLAPKTWGSLGAGHVGAVFALGWLPWIADAAIAQLRTRRPGIRYRLPVLWAVQFLADPRMAAYTALLVVGLFSWRLILGLRIARRQSGELSPVQSVHYMLRPWVAVGILAVGLSAVQWLPMADLVPDTTRASLMAEESGIYSLPIEQLMGIFWPHRGGFHEWMIYMGVAVLWLAILGWFTRSRSVRYGTAAACFLLVVVALGINGPLYPLLLKLPGVSFLRVPARVWHLLILCLAVLAGLGADALASPAETWQGQRRRLRRVAGVLIAFTGLMGVGMWMLDPDPTAGPSALWAFACLGMAIVVSEAAMASRIHAHGVGIALGLIVAADLVFVDSSLVQQMSVASVFADDLQVVGRIASVGGRIYAPSFRPSQHILARGGVRAVNGVDPLHLAEYSQFLSLAAGVDQVSGYSVTLPRLPDHADPVTALADDVPDLALLSILDVRAIVSQFELDESLENSISPEAWGELNIYFTEPLVRWPAVFQRVKAVRNLDEALQVLREDGLDDIAVVQGGHPLYGPAGYRKATVVSSTPNRLLIKASGPGLLVVSEVAHRGWKARVDGTAVEIYRADGVLRGVYLSDGDHTIDMRYRPPAVFWGLGVSILSVCGLVVAYRSNGRCDD